MRTLLPFHILQFSNYMKPTLMIRKRADLAPSRLMRAVVNPVAILVITAASTSTR